MYCGCRRVWPRWRCAGSEPGCRGHFRRGRWRAKDSATCRGCGRTDRRPTTSSTLPTRSTIRRLPSWPPIEPNRPAQVNGRCRPLACQTRCSPPAQKISRRAYWLSDPDLRQHSHAGLNKGEASNSVRRAVFFHHQGEIRDRPDQQARHPDNQIIGRAKKISWNRPSVRAGLGRAATPPHRGPPLPKTRAPRSARKLARRQA